MTDPSTHPDEVIFVGVTEWDRDGEQTCVIEPGRFSGITKTSMVRYRMAQRTTLAQLTQALADRTIRTWRDTMPPELVAEITRGFGASKWAKVGDVEILRRHGLLPRG